MGAPEGPLCRSTHSRAAGPKRTRRGMAPVAVCGLCSAFGRGQYGAPPYSTWRADHGPCAAYTPTFHSKSNLVCTRVGYFDAVGAGRAARHRPLGGREGAGIACTLAANAQRGVPGRIVMCHPNPPPSFARRGGSGPGTIRSLSTHVTHTATQKTCSQSTPSDAFPSTWEAKQQC